ncbi:MAG TPA: hypothetical protein VND98_10475 [Solirubrobacterales bacterium]|nr:hypothetical protein [Solirubrobacterales bacterium]
MSAAGAPIHQTLHGYEDGHRLLGGSVEIAPQDRRRMLTMSDSPDAPGLDPERSLMLGYPLPSEGFFVVSRTWAAPEVDRPGCVWTHSLLIDRNAQADLDPRSLLGLFRRPSAVDDAGRYEEPIKRVTRPKRPKGELPEVLGTLLWTLYQPPLAPVDLRSEALGGFDPQLLLLTIWDQQWPALRSRFSFGQAPRTGRRLDGTLLDLQITERPQKGSWDPEKGPAPPRTVVKPVADGVPDWSADLCEDLHSPGALRQYLWEWGPSRKPDRDDMWGLASLFALRPQRRPSGSPAETTISVFERAYPKPKTQSKLKRAIFQDGAGAAPPGPLDNGDLLAALAGSGLPASLSEAGLDLLGRSRRLVRSDPGLSLALVEAIPSRPDEAQMTIAEGIAEGLTKTAIGRWSKEDSAALAKLVNRSPLLAAHTALWEAVDFEEFWPLVRGARGARERRSAMLLGMLGAHSAEFVDAAFAAWPDTPELYLDLLAEGKGTWRSEHYLAELSRPTVASWLGEHGPAPKVVSVLLEAWKPKHLSVLPAREWQAVKELGAKLSDFHLALYFIAACDPESGLGPARAIEAYEAVLARPRLKEKAMTALRKAAGKAKSTSRVELAATLLELAFQVGNWKPIALLEIKDRSALKSVLMADRSGEIVGQLVGELGDTELPGPMAQMIFDAAMKIEDQNILRAILNAARDFIPWFRGSSTSR